MIRRYKNIIMVGTSHISKDSIAEVERSMGKYKPKVMALELDPARLNALFIKNPRRASVNIGKTGVKGFLFAIIGAWIEKRLGKVTGSTPGAEMKHAALMAQKNNIKIILIDQHINLTLRNISRRITFKEKLRFCRDIVKSFFSLLPKEIDIQKVPKDEQITMLTHALKKQYPSIYRSVIEDRDAHMSKALYKIALDNYKNTVMAVIGAGHVAGIINHLEKEKWPNKSSAKKKQAR